MRIFINKEERNILKYLISCEEDKLGESPIDTESRYTRLIRRLKEKIMKVKK